MEKILRNNLIFVLGVVFIFITSTDICKAEEQEYYIEETTIKATDIEIEGYEEELMVGETMSLTATVVPNNATDTSVIYKSSDTKIATVKSNGTVSGVAQGKVIIYVTSGDITKELHLTVKIKTKAIEVNTQYIVMQVGEQFKLEANVVPNTADNKLTYKSIDKDIAIVSGNGTIDAKACGSTTVVVSNGYAQTVVTVVVNENSVLDEVAYDEVAASDSDIEYPDTINADECAVITSDMLKFYYDRKKNLTIYGNRYNIYLSGLDIVNCENELNPQIHFNEVEKGISFEIRDKLCGKITLDLSDMVTNERYLFLYDDNKEKYQEISIKDINTITIDTEGKYLISAEKLSDGVVNKFFVIIGLVAVVLGIGIYVIVKKRYWFW